MLSYPDQNDRGLYLGIWSAMRNSGSIIGGAINFSTNYADSSAGGIAWSTYLIFVGFASTGMIYALLLSPTRLVRRSNGTAVPSSETSSWKHEFIALWKHAQRPKTWLVFIPAFYSFFYGGTMGTYLTLHFSVRARALSSLITRKSKLAPQTFICSQFHSNRHNPTSLSFWQTLGHEAMVPKTPGMDLLRLLGHPTNRMLHLDRNRVQQIRHQKDCAGLQTVSW